MKVPPTGPGTRIEDFEPAYSAEEQYQHFLDANAAHNNAVLNAVNEEYAETAGGAADSPFSEYMWMENEEEFDKEVLQRLEEEELMEQCMIRHMLDSERSPLQQPQGAGAANVGAGGVTGAAQTAESASSTAAAKGGSCSAGSNSKLNPHAAEFVPSWGRGSEGLGLSSDPATTLS